MKHTLSLSYSLCIELDNEKLRFVVLKNDEAFVCRKESPKKLDVFLSTENNQIFKGRLRLKKMDDVIAVEIKGATIGKIKVVDFQQLLLSTQGKLKKLAPSL